MRLQAGRRRGATFCFGGLQKAKYGPALGVGAKGTAARLGIGVDATGAGPVGGEDPKNGRDRAAVRYLGGRDHWLADAPVASPGVCCVGVRYLGGVWCPPRRVGNQK